jgi:glycosyltransferase involved in cell wall biosynthesis
MTYPILWDSNAPHAPTGYGQQTALFAERLAAAGYDVAVAAIWGVQAAPTRWHDLTVFPAGTAPGGADTLLGHAMVHFHGQAGLVLALADAWALDPSIFRQLPHKAVWMPVDTDRLSAMDASWLQATKTTPIAMSQHGLKQLQRAGFDNAYYIPHGIDLTVFNPSVDRDAARAALDIPSDAFVVGINAANKGAPSRKAFGQQFLAFHEFSRKHADAMLAVHSYATAFDGENLYNLADAIGIKPERLRFTNQYLYASGMLPADFVAGFYRAADVVSNATMGEGFGLPTIEAQACGRPVVVTNTAASRELCGAGWKVSGIPYWVDRHQAFWMIPDTKEISAAYESAYKSAEKMSQSAVGFANRYAVDKILNEYWLPTLEKISPNQE